MIILKTNRELKLTFERLIKTMKVPVEWNGNFVIVGDYLILHGRVRSLFFNFENRKVLTNLIDIPVKEGEVIELENDSKVQNVLNLALYAFGNWGSIKGLKVEQDYAQLNALFGSVLQEFLVEPGYNKENFRFYKKGIRINYEDVIQLAVEADEEKAQETEVEEKESGGLWHKLVWKKKRGVFSKTETTFEQRQKERKGKNFYMVGYQCPKCRENLHMVVFPEGEEFRIETEEGGVLLARAYACDSCNCFYTPKPKRLLSEGDVYAMEFLGDRRAYEDYFELLGESGDRVSNYKFNEYAAAQSQNGGMEQEESLEDVCERMDELTDGELEELQEKMEEGFYPAGSVRKLEHMVHREENMRKKAAEENARAAASVKKAAAKSVKSVPDEQSAEEMRGMEAARMAGGAQEPERKRMTGGAQESERKRMAGETGESKAGGMDEKPSGNHPAAGISGGERDATVPAARKEATKKRYLAKLGVLNRLSPAQLSELKGQLVRESSLDEDDRNTFLERIEERERQQKKEQIRQLADNCKNQNYAGIRRVIEKIKGEELTEEEKQEILQPLYEQKKTQGEAEVRQLVENLPAGCGLQQYRALEEKLNGYPEVDKAPYQGLLEERRKQAEEKEIAGMIRRVRPNDRVGLAELMERLQNQNFDTALAKPYLEKLTEMLRAIDEKALDEICGNSANMGEEEAMEAYRRVEQGIFLPELKTNALEMLTKRLTKLKTDECELLVQKLKEEMNGRVKASDSFHFYPARKVMLQEAQPEELRVIRYALDTYGVGRGTFEYPILVADTSRDGSGKEGMILTPEHLFYRTLFTAYVVSVFDIRGVRAQTGLLNAGLFLEMKDGRRIKIPNVLSRRELSAWAGCLDGFVRYLQEKPDSRKLTYLAREKHETICCFRCGYSYKGGSVCPKCGYKMNQ